MYYWYTKAHVCKKTDIMFTNQMDWKKLTVEKARQVLGVVHVNVTSQMRATASDILSRQQ